MSPRRAAEHARVVVRLPLAACVLLAACGTEPSPGSPTGARGGTSGTSGGATVAGASGSAGERRGGTGGVSTAGSGGAGGTAGATPAGGAGSTGAGGKAGGGAGAGGTAGSNAGEGGEGATEPGVRGVTDPVVVFDGTELDLERQYGLYHQSQGSVEIVPDPAGGSREVLRFVRPKDEDWTHEMVRLMDKRTDYADVAQVTEWETAYHYRQEMYVPRDPQYSSDFVNLLEDFHCEPCEANNLQIYTSYVEDDSVCIWIAYSTDEAFDPRGPDRGGSTDPWGPLGDSRLELWLAPDGTPTLPDPMPDTASVLLCRDDLRVSDLFERWVSVEIVVKVSSFDTGAIQFYIDDKSFLFEGPNGYRYNQTGAGSADALPVNVFQWGLYMGQSTPAAGTPDDWVLYATPPLLELGSDVLPAR